MHNHSFDSRSNVKKPKSKAFQTLSSGFKRIPRVVLSAPRYLFSKRKQQVQNHRRYGSHMNDASGLVAAVPKSRDEERVVSSLLGNDVYLETSYQSMNTGRLLDHEPLLRESDVRPIVSVESQVINDVERSLRAVIILLVMYLLGVYRPSFNNAAENILKVTLIAWATTLLMQVLVFTSYISFPVQGRNECNSNEQEPLLSQATQKYDKVVLDMEEDNIYVTSNKQIDERGTNQKNRFETEEQKEFITDNILETSSNDLDDDDGNLTDFAKNLGVGIHSPDHRQSLSNIPIFSPQNHPELDDVFVINDFNDQRATCNDDRIPLETEYIQGNAWFSVRTSDADKKIAPLNSGGTSQNDTVSNYFRKKQRRFELQMQFKFKKVPDSNIFIGFFIDEQIQLGMVQRAFVNAALGFLQKKLKGSLHCNTTGDSPTEDEKRNGNYERPHFAISLLQTLDRFVISPEGVTPPQLGTEIHEDLDSMKRRKASGFSIAFNTRDTYTMCLWSAYVDFVKWKVVNLPMVRPFSISSVIGDQPLYVILYSINKQEGETKSAHSERNMNQILNYQVSNAKSCALNGARKRYVEKCSSTIRSKEKHEYIDESSDEEASLGDEYSFDDEYDDETTAVVEDLGEGIYVRSGDSLVLRETCDKRCRFSTLSNSGGFATLTSFSSTHVIMEKIRSPRDSFHHESTLVRNGDTVMIKSFFEDSTTPSYLSVHKGIWLKWVNRLPRSSGFFLVNTSASESKHVTHVEAHSSYLRVGGEFTLTSKTFGLEVGSQLNESAAFGGRVLGLRPKSYRGQHASHQLAPLLFRADEEDPSTSLQNSSPEKPPSPHLKYSQTFELSQFHIDVPAWVEVLHRTRRVLQRAYVMRATSSASNSFVRFRTGKDLTPLIRVGLSLKVQKENDQREISLAISTEDPMFTIEHSSSRISQSDDECLASNSSSDEDDDEEEDLRGDNFYDPSTKSNKFSNSHGWRKNTAQGFSNVARGFKTGSITVSKALAPKIRKHRSLPKTPGKRKRSVYKDHHVAINRTLKSSRHSSSTDMSNALAGQLNAGCQTCRTVDNIISGIQESHQANVGPDSLSNLLSIETELDTLFLTGGLLELGVEPKDFKDRTVLGEYVVAKAYWQSFWKEQALIIDSHSLYLYNPLSTCACLVVAFIDVRDIREIDDFTMPACPLVSYPLLAIETSSVIHYIAFRNKEIRLLCFDTMIRCLRSSRGIISEKDKIDSFWQGFQSLTENKWTKIVSKKKMKDRIVLNTRKTAFDCPSFESVEQCEAHVRRLLSQLLTFESVDVVQPDQFVECLDLACGLKNLPLKRLNKSDVSTLCICVNLYHALLLHALLLFGAPSKKEYITFMRTHCYEVGGDVFSLAELDSCVLSGKYTRPYKSPFATAPKNSIATYPKLYALEYIDSRLHFVLCRHLSESSAILILSSETLEEQLISASRNYLSRHMSVDFDKRVIVLPKLCSIFRNDFGTDHRSCVTSLLPHLDPVTQVKVSTLLEDGYTTVIKYESGSTEV